MIVLKADRVWPRVKANDPCPCKSGKKFKRCCWRHNAELKAAVLDQARNKDEMERRAIAT
jgi:hypothetical protein